MLKNDIESQNFAIFEEGVDNLGRSGDDIMLWKDAYFQKMHTVRAPS